MLNLLKHSFAFLLKFYSRFTFTFLSPLLILFFSLPNQHEVLGVRKASPTASDNSKFP